MTVPTPLKRVKDFEDLGFGMFVHWGLYSQLGVGEWTYWTHKRDMNEYKLLKDSFTAEDFSAEDLVLTAKRAGCKYITLTTRHHEGFSLYDTCGLNDFDAPHSPAGRDLVREFVDACNKHGIVPFFYHTTLDWYNPDFNDDFDSYLEYLRKSVEILCKNYGKIGGLWFDGNWSKRDADWKEDALYATIRKYQPDAIIVNNTGLEARGKIGNPEIDSVTFEQGRPTPMDRAGMDKYIAAEMCCTLNNHWGIGYRDFDYKSPAALIENLCACRKVGANYLLNIGPEGDGKIPFMQEALLHTVGEWIRKTGENIYAVKPCGVFGEHKNFALTAGGKIYFFVHDLTIKGNENVTVAGGGAGDKLFEGVKGKVKSVRWTDNGEALAFKQDGEKVTIDCTAYPYGTNLVVRIAEAEME